MEVVITTTSPTWEQFEEWSVQDAYPLLYVDFKFKELHASEYTAWIQVQIRGHYYCSGSRNLEYVEGEVSELDFDDLREDEVHALRDMVTYKSIGQALKGILVGSLSDHIKSILEDAIYDYTPS